MADNDRDGFKKSGGYAFPSSVSVDAMGGLNFSGSYPNTGGMSLRDYFAARALQGMCSGKPWPDSRDGYEMALRAYRFADAMLALRAEGEGGE